MINDLTGRHTINVVGAPVLTAGGPYGLGSYFFDTSHLEVTDNLADFNISNGSGPVCIEARFLSNSVGYLDYFLSSKSGLVGWRFGLDAATLRLERNNSTSNWEPGINPRDGEFHSLALQISVSDALEIYIDGQRIVQFSAAGWRADPSGVPLLIGAFAGGIDRVRLAHVRVTRALRYAGNYVPAEPVYGSGDPLWPQTVLALRMDSFVEIPPAPVVVTQPVADEYGLCLAQIGNGQFDLQFFGLADGDAPAARYVQTLMYAVLFTDAEAPASREPDRYLRRGWWHDPAAGSSLWHIRRQPLGSAARREAVEAVRTALEAYGLTGVAVTERSPASVSSVVLEVAGFYRDLPYLVSVPL
jgi:phage gp46-like protein